MPVWPNRVKNKVEARLAALALAGRTETYGAMARDLGLRMAELTTLLEQMMAEDHARDCPFRAVLCEGRLAGGMPARGFFEAAEALGRDVSDPARFVAEERAALFSAAATGYVSR